jgi:VWFA-related protein
MRKLLAGVTAACALALPAGPAAQDRDAQPTFQSRVDLVTIDVAALDGQGNPVPDLRPDDFTVKVDGKSRRVVAADFVRITPGGAVPASVPAAVDAPITTNAAVRTERRIVIAVDQTLIRPAGITPLLRTAARFVDGLSPGDYAGFVAFPEPGPRVELTLDKTRVREAMQRVVGNPRSGANRQFDMSLSEAIAINDKERTFSTSLGLPEAIWRSLGPSFRRVLERGCQDLTIDELMLDENARTFAQCVRDVTAEAVIHQNQARIDMGVSIGALERVLAELAPMPGHKSMVLFSAGLVVENLTALDRLMQLAAAARTAITVIAVDSDQDADVGGRPNSQSRMSLQDRSLELQGLETIADRTGGRLVRASGGTGAGIFDRISQELSAWYVVAVERERSDADRQRLEVTVRRRGVTVRSNRMAVAAAAVAAARPPGERLREALASPVPLPGLRLRIATFARRDPGRAEYRLHLAAEMGQPGARAREYSVGYAVFDQAGKLVASSAGRQQLEAGDDEGEAAQFDTVLAIGPGTYSLRFGAVDPDGRVGTVIRPLQVAALSDTLSASDMMVGEGDKLRAAVEPVVRTGRISAYVELYPPAAGAGDLTVSFEIAQGDSSPALASAPLNLSPGAQPAWRTASGGVDVSLEPGRYVARATVRQGDLVVRVLTRPFVLARTDRRVTAAAARGGSPMPLEFRQRTAAFVAGAFTSLAQLVAQEDFLLEGPSRRVVSDFLLVRYPGSQQDLLTFRDVIRVNGKDLPNRETRLTELFLQPRATIAERVNQIREASESHVPSTLNPIFVLAFLQADLQRRFELTMTDAGGDWPAGVKAVTFVETARPTLLRGFPRGGDVPVRGTAWIEERTGRVLRSEARIGEGRSAPGVTTTFRFDESLNATVPVEMRTRNPDGVATYSNIRRFRVETETILPDAR